MDPSPASNPSGDLTIVVPVSNMSGRLEWVKGLLQGETGPVVIVHDERDAATGRELRELTKGFPRSTLIEGSYGAPGLARMAGLREVTTTYVAFVDSDDDSMGGKPAARLSSILETGGADVIAGSFIVTEIDTGEERLYSAFPDFQRNIKGHPGIWRYIFRVAFLRNSKVEFSDLKVG